MITVAIYGRLGGDPVERRTRDGTLMATASLAVNAARFNEESLTEWFSLAAFGRQAEALLRHAKGDLLAAMGPLVRSRYTGRDGVERTSWSLTAESIVSARTVRPGGRRKRSDGRGQPQQSSDATSPAFDDEIPF